MSIPRFFLFFLTLQAIFFTLPGFAADEAYVQSLKARARAAHLADFRDWQNRLLYVRRVLRPASSVIDGDHFFLAKTGKSDPAAELDATLEGFFRSVDPKTEEQHPLCLYPSRLDWLAGKLKIEKERLPKPSCKNYREWRESHPVNGATFVFASYFINNPASMFGHTFLRLHRPRREGAEPSPLLDFAVNFAANPTTDNSLLYPMLGLSGGFPGTFSLMPYYLKVQEYNNAESRDLWEYNLELSPKQIDLLMQVLWEIGPHPIDYFYIDENCSYVIMLMLSTLSPEFTFGDEFNLLVTPADTLRVMAKAPRFIGNAVYRPSILSKYQQREAHLSSAEVVVLRRILNRHEEDPSKSLQGLAAEGQARVIDAALDYIDFKEDLAGSKQAVKFKFLRDTLLTARSKLRIPPIKTDALPQATRPDLGHTSMRLGLTGGQDQGGYVSSRYLDFEWQPTLHDLASPSAGYSPDLQLLMANVKIRKEADNQRPRLQRLTLFSVLSVPRLGEVMTPLSWRFSLGAERERHEDSPWVDCLLSRAEGGIGFTEGWGGSATRVYGLALIEAGAACGAFSEAFAGPGFVLGVLHEFTPTVKLSAKFQGFNEFAQHHYYQRRESILSLSMMPRSFLELKMTAEIAAAGDVSYGAGFGCYY